MTVPELQHPFEPNELFPGVCTRYHVWFGGQVMCGQAESALVHSNTATGDVPVSDPEPTT